MSRTLHLRERTAAGPFQPEQDTWLQLDERSWVELGGRDAGVAHSVERNLAKVEVAGSKPVSRSSITQPLPAGPPSIAEFTDPRLVAIYDSLNPYLPDRQPGFYVGLAAELGAVEIVDLGCGTGLITRELARLGYRVTAVDPAPAMLDIARQRPYGDRVRWI